MVPCKCHCKQTNNINFEVCLRVLSQSVYALLLSLIQAVLNMSTLSMNEQRKSFWELVYGSVNQVLTDHYPAVLVSQKMYGFNWATLYIVEFVMVWFVFVTWQLQACQRKLDSKCEALLILSKDLDQCRQERDQFQLMAEQVQSRYQSIKRQLAGIVSTPVLYAELEVVQSLS